MEPKHDPQVGHYIPDRENVARAQRELLASESHQQRYIRQRWEEACGANRVTLAALREVFPTEIGDLTAEDRHCFQAALEHVTDAFIALDLLTETMIGQTMRNVLLGNYSADDLDSLGVPRDADET